MTDDIMKLRALVVKTSDADLLREMIDFTAQRLMELEVEGCQYARRFNRICRRSGAGDRHERDLQEPGQLAEIDDRVKASSPARSRATGPICGSPLRETQNGRIVSVGA